MTKVKNKQTVEQQENNSALFAWHTQYKKLPPAIRMAIWGGLSFAALQGLRYYKNEGLINDAVCVPIIEEVIYRGVLQPGIKKVQQVWNARHKTKMNEESTRNRVIASSVLFGISHSGLNDIVSMTWNMGRACGYLSEKTGSLFAPTALHMATNFIAVTSLKGYFRQEYLYPALFYSMGKKIFPIPNFITTPIVSLASKVRGLLTSSQNL